MTYGNTRQKIGDRRTRGDRRRCPTNPLTLASLRGRRISFRRQEDLQAHPYVDRYDSRTFFLVLTIATCCILDTFYTLELVSKGGIELNPFMALLLQIGPVHFFQAKYLLTAVGLVWLLVHKNHRLFRYRVKTSTILGTLAFCYVGLICYELSLL